MLCFCLVRRQNIYIMNVKLILSALVILVFGSNLKAQLPVIQAKGEGKKTVDWAVIAEKEAAEELGFFENPCAQGVSPMHVSSFLKGQGNRTYVMQNLADDNPMTAWVEGVLGYGIGEWFEIKAITVNTIYNGYQSSPKNWKNNSRVKRFKVYQDGQAICYLDLLDEMGAQHFELPHRPNWETKANFRFEIVDVYKGDKWEDVCISHVDHVACCFAPTTQIYLPKKEGQAIKTIEEGTEILGVNLEQSTTFLAKVELTTQQLHLSLLKVATAQHQILITPDHPLYIEGYGFISLGQLLVKKNYKDWKALAAAQIQVLVYDETTASTKFETIKSVKKEEGSFETHTILSLSKGDTYIANGFINKVY